jgi:hypothetical protein
VLEHQINCFPVSGGVSAGNASWIVAGSAVLIDKTKHKPLRSFCTTVIVVAETGKWASAQWFTDAKVSKAQELTVVHDINQPELGRSLYYHSSVLRRLRWAF